MTAERTTTTKLRRAIQNPSALVNVASHLEDQFVTGLRYLPHRTLGKRLFTHRYGEGIDPLARDWDNLIILDACRYDVFAEHNTVAGRLSSVVSRASHSDEYMIANYHGRDLGDTVYVSANPHTDKTLEPGTFHATVRTYNQVYWTQREFDSYHPRTVSDAALENYDAFRDKRIIVHFMQPHAPYLGPYARALRRTLNAEGVKFGNAPNDDLTGEPVAVVRNLMEAARNDYISDDALRQCYVENLELVLAEVERLLDHIDGKTVITADHGELLGGPERSLFVPERYGHPRGVYLPETRIVPWLVVDSGSRREITAGDTNATEHVSEEAVAEQLEALGYTS